MAGGGWTGAVVGEGGRSAGDALDAALAPWRCRAAAAGCCGRLSMASTAPRHAMEVISSPVGREQRSVERRRRRASRCRTSDGEADERPQTREQSVRRTAANRSGSSTPLSHHHQIVRNPIPDSVASDVRGGQGEKKEESVTAKARQQSVTGVGRRTTGVCTLQLRLSCAGSALARRRARTSQTRTVK